jgi:3-hydroxy-9,10-secoandrosta-1,3,5(10)-triene-9,17-dione monooxygenase
MPRETVTAKKNVPPIDTGSSAEAASKAEILARLIERAKELVPALRERAARTEQMRRLPDETVREFKEAGFFKAFRPVRYGGYELDYGPPQLGIYPEIARACASSAWVMAIIGSKPWVVGMFAKEAQDDVYGGLPEAIVCDALSPEGAAEFEPVKGGFRLSGRWKFASGVDFADWTLLGAAAIVSSDRRDPVFCLVPKRDYKIIDTWFVGGLRGTGSKDVEVSGAFVPEHRVVPVRLLTEGKGPGTAVNSCHIYRFPLFSVFPFNTGSPALGIARAVIEQYCERAQTQVSTITRVRIANIESNQLQVSEASVLVDCAMALLSRDAEELNRKGRAGLPITIEDRVRYKRDLAYGAQLCMRAVDMIHYISGAHALFEENPLQRAFRDVHAINAHIGLRWDNNGLPYGRIAMGLDYNDPLL